MQFFRRGGQTLYICNRVPSRYKAVEQCESVWISLQTDAEIVSLAPKVWSDMIEAWEAILDGLNSEARGILLGLINTGYRPSEGAMLGRDQIKLDQNVPHLSIEPVGRQLKGANARHMVRISLEAFHANPDDFPRYADCSALRQLRS